MMSHARYHNPNAVPSTMSPTPTHAHTSSFHYQAPSPAAAYLGSPSYGSDMLPPPPQHPPLSPHEPSHMRRGSLPPHTHSQPPPPLDWQWFDSFTFQQPVNEMIYPHHASHNHNHSHSAEAPSHPQSQYHPPPGYATTSYSAPPSSLDSMVYAADIRSAVQPTPAFARAVHVPQTTAVGSPVIPYGSINHSLATQSPNQPKRKPRRKLACSNCRHVKSECSGERPCRRCVRLDKAHTCHDPTEPYPPKKARPSMKKDGSTINDNSDSNGNGYSDSLVKQEGKKDSDNDNDENQTMNVSADDNDNDDADTKAHTTNNNAASPLSSNDDDTNEPRDKEWVSPAVFHQCISAFAETFLRPPLTVTPQSTMGIVRRMGHLFETMPPPVFQSLLERMGYQPDVSVKDEPKDSSSPGAALSSALSTNDELGDDHSTTTHSSAGSGSNNHAHASQPLTKKTAWRSPHSHLPYVSLPHRFRLNWSLTPDRAFVDTPSIGSAFPFIMWLHYPGAAHFIRNENGAIYPCPIPTTDPVLPVPYTVPTPLPPLADDQTPLQPSEIDISHTEQFAILLTNPAFERLFGHTQQQLKQMFKREGKRAFLRLFACHIQSIQGSDMKHLNQEGVTEFYHWVVIRTKFNTNIKTLMHRRLMVDEVGFVVGNRYTFISLPHNEEMDAIPGMNHEPSH